MPTSRAAISAWLHVDGAFGLWAAASGALRHHVRGIERADSWATDAHKWLNVPYDSGLVFVAHPAAHRAAMSLNAAYLVRSRGRTARADGLGARVVAPGARLRRLRGAALARPAAASRISSIAAAGWRGDSPTAAQEPTIRILNDVVLNQVLVRVVPPDGDADAATRDALRLVQEERVCWLGGIALARHGRDADLGVQLVDDRRRHRSVRGFDHPRRTAGLC